MTSDSRKQRNYIGNNAELLFFNLALQLYSKWYIVIISTFLKLQLQKLTRRRDAKLAGKYYPYNTNVAIHNYARFNISSHDRDKNLLNHFLNLPHSIIYTYIDISILVYVSCRPCIFRLQIFAWMERGKHGVVKRVY